MRALEISLNVQTGQKKEGWGKEGVLRVFHTLYLHIHTHCLFKECMFKFQNNGLKITI